MKTASRWLLPLAMALFAVVSCGKEPEGGSDVPDESEIIICNGGATDYVLVYQDAVSSAASELVKAFSAKAAVSMPSGKSSTASVKPLEILLGSTGREETEQVLSEIGAAGYAIETVGRKFVIVATDDALLARALYDFQSSILKNAVYNKSGTINLKTGFRKVMKNVKTTFRDCIESGWTFSVQTTAVGNCPAIGSCSVAQGACSDGKFVYFVLCNSGDTEAVICKYTLSPFAFIASSDVFNGGHCNDLAFDTAGNRIILAHGQTQGKILTPIDASTLKVGTDFNITVGSGAITYCSSRAKYAISQGGSTLHFADASFNVLSSNTRTDSTGYTAQGMGSDDAYIYFPMSGSGDNVLVTYNWDAKYVTTITVSVAMESESMFCVNDDYYICFYKSGSGAVLHKMTPVPQYIYK